MRVWLVNPFDPLFGEEEQLGRYARLAVALRNAGHAVVWWSSGFSHRFKRNLDARAVSAAAAARDIDVQLIQSTPYRRNVSLARIRNHRAYARSFATQARLAPRPDVIVASSPPLESAREAGRLGREWNLPVLVDIQDQWPDNFRLVVPRAFRRVAGAFLAPFYTLEREAYSLADGIIGVARGYVERGIHVGGQKKFERVFPLGVSLDEVDAAVAQGARDYAGKWIKPPGQVWLLYSGSLSRTYDFLTIVHAAVGARKRFGDKVRFIITGRGEQKKKAEKLVRQNRLNNLSLTGFLDFSEWAYLASLADAGFNASFPEALIYFPNKIFYYFAMGAAVLNTIPGQCAELVERERCGLNYTAGDPESCLAAISQLIGRPDDLAAMGRASRSLAERMFDEKIVYAEFARFLEHVCDAWKGGRG